ncbi:TlpA family protein disulfide reductase [Deferrisoma camini]|uniref:TlpA family protein disulfide reductase n=1 Tax=Deferrisoma camini TaxID=1035120 RepID=UPI00146D5515|nr:TlpA disulfide reductase family protein [Deferrisoma camini]
MRPVLTAVLAAVALVGTAAAEPLFRLLDPGEQVAPFELRDPQGASHRLARAEGTPELLFFWSVYCPNCKEAMPGLVELSRRWQGRGVRVWAVNVDGERFSNAVRSYVRAMELPFPVVYDRLEGETLVAADPLGVTKTPTLYLLDGKGRVVTRQVVEVDYAQLERDLERLLSP